MPPLDPAGRLRQILDINKRELLTTDQIAARFPNFPSREAVRSFIRRWRVPVTHVGRDPRGLAVRRRSS